jgi:hypothetical protein
VTGAMPRSKRNFLVGGAILLAVPFVAGIMRKSFIQFPREVWVGLTILAMIGAAIGIVVMLRSREEDR